MNWHKLRVGQLDAPTVRLIRKASQKLLAEFVYYSTMSQVATVWLKVKSAKKGRFTFSRKVFFKT